MAVNEPIPRVQPEGEVCLRRHNSLATSESLIYLLPEVMQDASRQGYYYKDQRHRL